MHWHSLHIVARKSTLQTPKNTARFTLQAVAREKDIFTFWKFDFSIARQERMSPDFILAKRLYFAGTVIIFN